MPKVSVRKIPRPVPPRSLSVFSRGNRTLLQVLEALGREDNVSVSQLRRAAGCHDHKSVKHACEVLEVMGLAQIQHHNRDPTVHVLITQIGKDIADTVRERALFEHGHTVAVSSP